MLNGTRIEGNQELCLTDDEYAQAESAAAGTRQEGLIPIQKTESDYNASIVEFRDFELNMEARNLDCYIPPTV